MRGRDWIRYTTYLATASCVLKPCSSETEKCFKAANGVTAWAGKCDELSVKGPAVVVDGGVVVVLPRPEIRMPELPPLGDCFKNE